MNLPAADALRELDGERPELEVMSNYAEILAEREDEVGQFLRRCRVDDVRLLRGLKDLTVATVSDAGWLKLADFEELEQRRGISHDTAERALACFQAGRGESASEL